MNKKIFTILAAVLLAVSVFAQSPEKMSYQAVVRDNSNNLVTSTEVGVQISILQGSATGTAVYVETQTPTTNANGLISIEIGGGVGFDAINWANGLYFIKTETDLTGGTTYTITGTSQLLSVPYALYAKTAESVAGTITTYSVGDFAHGGIVFWLDETSQHGLVCAKQDQSTGIRWYAGTFGNTRAFGVGPLSGEMNTAIIIASQVAIGDDGSAYAAYICAELKITEEGKTYGDWYLPSKDELYLMHQNKATINATATANGGSDFATDYYWSSTDHDNYDAWGQEFSNNGTQSYFYKATASYVRAVRAF